MLAFRPALLAEDSHPLTPGDLSRVCREVIDASNFVVSPQSRLSWSHCYEEPFWELFLGQALGRAQTRERRRFESWWVSIENGDPEEPLLALRWDHAASEIHVTRSIECRVREGYESQPGVFDSRTVTRWVRELIGTVDWHSRGTVGRLRDELQGLLFQAVVGVSRLPITSLESPLPAFTLGQLMYSFRALNSSFRARAQLPLADSTLPILERAKSLEFALRTSEDVAGLAAALVFANPKIDDWLALLFRAFNAASLSPYTKFVPRAMNLLRQLTNTNLAVRADFVARLVMLLDRHLCAYDLVKFHHRGANYPDALLLDELWQALLEIASMQPELFAEPGLRRRAVRHALLLRLDYAGYPVPDWPTSIGENARIMAQPFRELPEEQIHAPTRRTRKLFDSALPPDHWAWETLGDLADPHEIRELGTALFLNRPLGIGKLPGEPDRTPLLSHVLVSQSIAERRLAIANRRPGGSHLPARWAESIDGLPLADCGSPPKLGVVSLHDAMLTADDWIVLRTTRSSFRDWDSAFVWSDLGIQPSRDWRLLLPEGNDLIAYDDSLNPAARITIELSAGYRLQGGVEVPVAGLIIEPIGSSNKSRVVPAFAN
jgi:hypothetical protein